MLFFHPARWIIAFACGVMIAGCTSGTATPDAETGSLSLDLVIGDGVVINQVRWTISGGPGEPPMEPMKGTIDTSAPGASASVEVFGLPPTIGQDYTIEMEAEAEDGTECEGSENFGIDVGEVTEIMVFLNCKRPQRLGAVRVNGKFNICPELVKATASPLETSVGNDIDLSAEGVDADEDDVFYEWSAMGGSIDDPSAEATTYTCEEVGDHMIRIDVTDGDDVCDPSSWTFPVTCEDRMGGASCEDDGDCGSLEICIENGCVQVPCKRDDDCALGLECSDTFFCIPKAECTDNQDCGELGFCIENGCIRIDCKVDDDCAVGLECSDTFFCIPKRECTQDDDCDEDEICSENQCIRDLPLCEDDNDCDAGELCLEKLCVPDVLCSNDDDCGPLEICVENRCTQVDCKRDDDCAVGLECTDTYFCIPKAECTENDDCGPLGFCIENGCILVQCKVSDDCALGFECSDTFFCIEPQ